MGRDLITDYNVENDLIDLVAMDAKKDSDNQDFKFLGVDAFTGKAGELHYKFTGSDTGAKTILEGDLNGDKKADFQITLTGHIELRSSHILGVLDLAI